MSATLENQNKVRLVAVYYKTSRKRHENPDRTKGYHKKWYTGEERGIARPHKIKEIVFRNFAKMEGAKGLMRWRQIVKESNLERNKNKLACLILPETNPVFGKMSKYFCKQKRMEVSNPIY